MPTEPHARLRASRDDASLTPEQRARIDRLLRQPSRDKEEDGGSSDIADRPSAPQEFSRQIAGEERLIAARVGHGSVYPCSRPDPELDERQIQAAIDNMLSGPRRRHQRWLTLQHVLRYSR